MTSKRSLTENTADMTKLDCVKITMMTICILYWTTCSRGDNDTSKNNFCSLIFDLMSAKANGTIKRKSYLEVNSCIPYCFMYSKEDKVCTGKDEIITEGS